MYKIISQLTVKIRCAIRTPATSSLRYWSAETGEDSTLGSDLTVGEQKIISKLQEVFPDATHIQVSDISGGCGAMYQISIEAPAFAGLKTVQQHRLVNEALAAEIKSMHGLQLQTKAPDTNNK